jgi:hypothetical protein
MLQRSKSENMRKRYKSRICRKTTQDTIYAWTGQMLYIDSFKDITRIWCRMMQNLR